MKEIFNQIWLEMGLQYVEDDRIFDYFKKFIHRGLIRMFWTPVILIAKYTGFRPFHNQL